MTLRRVDPNGIYTDVDPGVSGVVVVGTQPVLADGSDATYLEVATPGPLGPTAQLSLLSSYTVGDPIALHVRLQIFLDGPTDPTDDWRIEPFLATDAPGTNEFAGFSDGASAGFAFHIDTDAAAGIVEQAVPLNLVQWSPTTTDDVAAALIAGAYLDLNSFRWVDGLSAPTLRLYEAWIGVGVPATKAPPCRLYPREDNQGVGSGRIWPPPRSQQASNRRGGGYY